MEYHQFYICRHCGKTYNEMADQKVNNLMSELVSKIENLNVSMR